MIRTSLFAGVVLFAMTAGVAAQTCEPFRGHVISKSEIGCIRMLNSDIMDLFDRVSYGTRVVVTR